MEESQHSHNFGQRGVVADPFKAEFISRDEHRRGSSERGREGRSEESPLHFWSEKNETRR